MLSISVVILFFGALGNNMLRNSVCRKNPISKIDITAKTAHLQKHHKDRNIKKNRFIKK